MDSRKSNTHINNLLFFYFMDMTTVVRFVDDFEDDDPRTRNSCPGTVNGKKLIHIANQTQRRFGFLPKRVKNVIYLEQGTGNIWYKRSKCNVGIVAMGFSLSRLANHPNAVPMEQYTKYFVDMVDLDWLERNDYVIV